jgi:hypothetical protein
MEFALGIIIGIVVFFYPALKFWEWYYERKDRKNNG